MKNEINIGGLSFVGERMGTHIHITVLGTGQRGHRPLCGKFVVLEAEWQAFEHAADTLEAMRAGAAASRLATKVVELEDLVRRQALTIGNLMKEQNGESLAAENAALRVENHHLIKKLKADVEHVGKAG